LITFFYPAKMNYLGHLFLSNNDPEIMQGNLYGDFVKGSQHLNLPPKIVQGVELHRQIDSFIDTHSSLDLLRKILSKDLPKIYGIAIDIYFDHLLAKNWDQYHPTPLKKYLNQLYEQLDFDTQIYSPKFLFFLTKMKEINWLLHSEKESSILKTCLHVSRKISFDNNLSESIIIFEKQQELITESFHNFMKEAMKKFNIPPINTI
jgi:acyl carrier protein phosphodiesterase